MGLFNFFKKESDKIEITEEGLSDTGVCSTCWGFSEYEDQFSNYVNNRDKDIVNKDHATQKAFIAKFVEERITGILLRDENGVRVCPVCSKK